MSVKLVKSMSCIYFCELKKYRTVILLFPIYQGGPIQMGEDQNDQPVRGVSELMLSDRGKDISSNIFKAFSPGIFIFGLPPMLSSDDTMGFLPFVDCGLIIVDDGGRKYSEVAQCHQQFTSATNLIGHVLNKSTDKAEADYDYYAR